MPPTELHTATARVPVPPADPTVPAGTQYATWCRAAGLPVTGPADERPIPAGPPVGGGPGPTRPAARRRPARPGDRLPVSREQLRRVLARLRADLDRLADLEAAVLTLAAAVPSRGAA